MSAPGYAELLRRARAPGELRTLAFAGVLEQARQAGSRPLIRGLSEDRFQRLVELHFPGSDLVNGAAESAATPTDEVDEFDDLLELLMQHRAAPNEESAWLCCAIASAAMGENHLWQDMGLPERKALSTLLRQEFPALYIKNTGDMRWKKFFYRQLCEQAAIMICKSPHCAVCADYGVCFGTEDAAPRTIQWRK